MLIELNQQEFLDWLEVDKQSLSWEDKYIDEFHDMWNFLFEDISDCKSHFIKINRMLNCLPSGPLKSWFIWLSDSYINYLFGVNNYSIAEIAIYSNKELAQVAFIIRSFLISNYPNLVDDINATFNFFSPQNENINLTFSDFRDGKYIILEPSVIGDKTLKDLEITLLENWSLVTLQLPVKKINKKNLEIPSVKKQMGFFQELILLFVLSGLLILGVKFANKWYEDYISKQVTLLESDFFWLDKNIVFESKSSSPAEIDLEYSEIEKIEKTENKLNVKDSISEGRYEDESDVVVTSIKTIPQDFEVAKSELSSYEEQRKGGYRDFRYGRRKAYRVMLTSVNPNELKSKLYKVLSDFKVKKVDNVDPGKNIPGGIYFNLFVPRNQVQKFLSQMSELKGATVLESKTIFGGPKNMDKVFIWIKKV